MKLLNTNQLGQTEKTTFRLHLTYNIIEGFIAGVLALNEFVFIKSLKGSNLQLSFLFQFSMIVFLFLIFFNEFIKRINDKKKLLRYTAIATRSPLLLLLFFPRSQEEIISHPYYHIIFLAVFLIYFIASPIIYPTINQFLKNTYRHENFGKLYGYATTINKIVLLLCTFIYGLWLDMDNYAFTYILPFVAIAGIASIFILSQIDRFIKPIAYVKKSFFDSIKFSAISMYRTLKNNKPYFDFELGFMFYGFAFMSTVAVVNIFFNDALHLNYSSMAFYKNAYNIIAILILPFFSRLIGKIDPRKFAMITFASIAFYLLSLAITEHLPYYFEIYNIRIYYTLILYICFHSVFAATMSLLWSIGSAYFCPKNQADIYQASHLSLTGIRAIFSPLAGIFLYEAFGYTITFCIAAFLLFIGIFIMILSYNRYKLEQNY